MSALFSEAQLAQLLDNGRRQAAVKGPHRRDRLPAGRFLYRVGLAFECPASAAAPLRHGLLTVLALEHRGKLQERAVEHSTIVAGKIDQTGLPNKPAELD